MQDAPIRKPDWLLIDRQMRRASYKPINLLAIDVNGSVIIIKVKRGKIPRDVVAQSIVYIPWVVTLADYQLIDIYQQFAERYGFPHATLEDAFEVKFGILLDSGPLSESYQLVVVAPQLNSSLERIINYPNEHAQLSIIAMFFADFEDGGNRYPSSAWLIDPDESSHSVSRKAKKESWNGEFYTSCGSV